MKTKIKKILVKDSRDLIGKEVVIRDERGELKSVFLHRLLKARVVEYIPQDLIIEILQDRWRWKVRALKAEKALTNK